MGCGGFSYSFRYFAMWCHFRNEFEIQANFNEPTLFKQLRLCGSKRPGISSGCVLFTDLTANWAANGRMETYINGQIDEFMASDALIG